eukprot:1187615-Prorocentrum_minimum.AAC.12
MVDGGRIMLARATFRQSEGCGLGIAQRQADCKAKTEVSETGNPLKPPLKPSNISRDESRQGVIGCTYCPPEEYEPRKPRRSRGEGTQAQRRERSSWSANNRTGLGHCKVCRRHGSQTRDAGAPEKYRECMMCRHYRRDRRT